MKSKIQKLGWFLFCLILCLTAIEQSELALLRNSRHPYILKIKSVLQKEQLVDISFWGSSTTWVHFNPLQIEEATDYSVYNYGLNGTNFHQYFGLVDEYLEDNDKSEILVFGLNIHGLQRRDQFTRNYFWLPFTHNNNVFRTIDFVNHQDAQRIKYVPFYKITLVDKHAISPIVSTFKSHFNNSLKENDEIKGFQPQYIDSKPELQLDTFTIDINEENVDLMIRCFKKYKEKGQKIILMITPCFEASQKAATNLDELLITIKKIEQKAGVDIVINFLEDNICRNRDLFYNQTHLNAEGAEIITDMFIDSLNSFITINRVEF